MNEYTIRYKYLSIDNRYYNNNSLVLTALDYDSAFMLAEYLIKEYEDVKSYQIIECVQVVKVKEK